VVTGKAAEIERAGPYADPARNMADMKARDYGRITPSEVAVINCSAPTP